MPIVGGLDIHRKQLTFDYLDTVTGEVKRGQIAPHGAADRGTARHPRRDTRASPMPAHKRETDSRHQKNTKTTTTPGNPKHLKSLVLRHGPYRCRIVPGADGPYHGMRANDEQTGSAVATSIRRRPGPTTGLWMCR